MFAKDIFSLLTTNTVCSPKNKLFILTDEKFLLLVYETVLYVNATKLTLDAYHIKFTAADLLTSLITHAHTLSPHQVPLTHGGE